MSHKTPPLSQDECQKLLAVYREMLPVLSSHEAFMKMMRDPSTPPEEKLEKIQRFEEAQKARNRLQDAVTLAIIDADIEVLKLYHDQYGIDVNMRPAYSSCSFLSYAVRKRNTEIVDFYMARGASLNKLTPGDIPPLAEAVINDDVALYQKLLKAGADPSETFADLDIALPQLARNNDATRILALMEGQQNTKKNKPKGPKR